MFDVFVSFWLRSGAAFEQFWWSPGERIRSPPRLRSAHAEAGDAMAPGEQSHLERDAGIPKCISHMAVIGQDPAEISEPYKVLALICPFSLTIS